MDLATLAMIAALAVLGYFMLIRPQQKRAKEQAALMKAVEPGTRVMMSGGIYGTIRHLGDKQVVVEVSPGVEITYIKQAIVRPLKDDEDEFEYDDATPIGQPVAQAGDATWTQPTIESSTIAPDDASGLIYEAPADESGSQEPPAKATDQG